MVKDIIEDISPYEREFLSCIKSRPALYLGKTSLTNLKHYLNGYRNAMKVLKCNKQHNILPDGLNEFVALKYTGKTDVSYYDWCGFIILYEKDEEAAFWKFFDLLDEYLVALGFEALPIMNHIDLDRVFFKRADIKNVTELLVIIHRCMNEVNYKDYAQPELKKILEGFTSEWLIDIINTRHYYEAWYQGRIIACGGVSRDYSQERQCYFTAIFVNPDYQRKGVGRKLVRFLEKDEWCLRSDLIEIPSSKSSHEFYCKCGYKYRNYPPIFSKTDGTTIMYRNL